MTIHRRPIGYYLKLLDRLIDERFERDLSAHAMGRRHWQVLNVLQAGPADRDALSEALRPFWTESGLALADVLRDLTGRGAVAHDGGRYELTSAGRELHTAVQERVAATRERLLDGLTADDYRAVIDTLARMARNLEEGPQLSGAA